MSRRQKRFPRFQQAFRAARTQIFLFLTEKYGFEHRTKPQSWHGSCEGENNKCAQQGRSARRRHATNDNIELKSGTRTVPALAVSRLKTRTSRPQGGQSQHRAEARCAPASRFCFLWRSQRRFKARKSPPGHTSTPTGLKRKIQRPMIAIRNGSASTWRSQIYTQARTHSERRIVRRFLLWWRRGESNSGPY